MTISWKQHCQSPRGSSTPRPPGEPYTTTEGGTKKCSGEHCSEKCSAGRQNGCQVAYHKGVIPVEMLHLATRKTWPSSLVCWALRSVVRVRSWGSPLLQVPTPSTLSVFPLVSQRPSGPGGDVPRPGGGPGVIRSHPRVLERTSTIGRAGPSISGLLLPGAWTRAHIPLGDPMRSGQVCIHKVLWESCCLLQLGWVVTCNPYTSLCGDHMIQSMEDHILCGPASFSCLRL